MCLIYQEVFFHGRNFDKTSYIVLYCVFFSKNHLSKKGEYVWLTKPTNEIKRKFIVLMQIYGDGRKKKFSSIIENYDVLASFWWVCDLHTSFGSIIMYKLKMEIFRQIRDVCQIFGYVPLCVDTKPTKMVFCLTVWFVITVWFV